MFCCQHGTTKENVYDLDNFFHICLTSLFARFLKAVSVLYNISCRIYLTTFRLFRALHHLQFPREHYLRPDGFMIDECLSNSMMPSSVALAPERLLYNIWSITARFLFSGFWASYVNSFKTSIYRSFHDGLNSAASTIFMAASPLLLLYSQTTIALWVDSLGRTFVARLCAGLSFAPELAICS